MFHVERDDKPLDITITPVDRSKLDLSKFGMEAVTEPTGYVGITYGSASKMDTVGPIPAIGRSVGDFGFYLKGTVGAFGKIFSPAGVSNLSRQVTNGSVSTIQEQERPVSPVGIVRFASQASEQFGLNGFLTIIVLINIFVGMFNLVPLLPLDGGHIAVATYERIRSRKGQRYQVDANRLIPITVVVMFVLIFLGLTAVWLDLFRPVSL